MIFDVIIIGGGHSGLSKGIELLKSGKSCLTICKGGSSRKFMDENYNWFDQSKEFEKLGGILMKGSLVSKGIFENNVLKYILLNGHGDARFEADLFYLATGSFFSGGLVATQKEIVEPIFNLDVRYTEGRESWVNPDFFGDQPFMKFGVICDECGCAMRGGIPIINVFPIGSIVAKK